MKTRTIINLFLKTSSEWVSTPSAHKSKKTTYWINRNVTFWHIAYGEWQKQKNCTQCVHIMAPFYQSSFALRNNVNFAVDNIQNSFSLIPHSLSLSIWELLQQLWVIYQIQPINVLKDYYLLPSSLSMFVVYQEIPQYCHIQN